MTREREITRPVDLCLDDGSLNPDAVGWSRRPLHRSNLRFGPGRWGRTKRWEYWGIVTSTHCVGVTASSLDYAGVLGIYVLERATGREWTADATVPLALGSTFPDRSGTGWVRAASKRVSIEIHQDAAGSVLAARGPGIALEVTVPVPEGHESMAVVVPWSSERFQYTVKDVARPASGALTLDGVRHEIPAGESYAVLDHGRGRWPYRTSWFWGAGSGPAGVSGVAQGIQVGGRWTDGTGSTENAVLVDGRVHKLGVELAFDLDPDDRLRPWRITGSDAAERVDLTLTPFHERRSSVEFGIIGSRIHQCFGRWSGTVETDAGAWSVDGLDGWIEEAQHRW